MTSSSTSPSADLRDALLTAATQVIERNCFAFVEPIEPDAFHPLATECTAWLCAEVSFRGSFHGALRVVLPVPLAQRLCNSFIGAFDEGEPADAQVFDFTGELANMMVGAWLSHADSHIVFDLSPPAVTRMPEGWQPGTGLGPAPALLAVDDAPVAVWTTTQL